MMLSVKEYVNMKDVKTCWQQWCSDFFLWGKPGRRPSFLLVKGAQPFVATNVASQELWQGESPVFDDGFVQHSEKTGHSVQDRETVMRQ
jgi:hypothetical protein